MLRFKTNPFATLNDGSATPETAVSPDAAAPVQAAVNAPPKSGHKLRQWALAACAVSALGLGLSVFQPTIQLAPSAVASGPVAAASTDATPVDGARGVQSYAPRLEQAMGSVVQVLVTQQGRAGMVGAGMGGGSDGGRGFAPQSGPAADGAAHWLVPAQMGPDQNRPNAVTPGQGGRMMPPGADPRGGSRGGPPMDPRGGPPRGGQPGGSGEVSGSGSGVIYNADRGLILTNHHVVDGASSIRIRLADGREVEGTLVGSDAATDIAVVRIPTQGLPRPIEAGPSEQVRVGDLAFAIGYPLGLERTLTMGIVSGLNRSGLGDGVEDFIQTDASINRGNSGGPLVDSQGRLIGINTAIFSPTGGNIGIGFAVPTQIAMSVARQIEANGSVRRGRIGVGIAPVTQEAATAAGLAAPQGALISAVEPGSPAARAGMREGDIVVSAGTRQVTGPRVLHAAVAVTETGQSLPLQVMRGRERIAMTVQIAPPRVADAAAGAPARGTPQPPARGGRQPG